MIYAELQVQSAFSFGYGASHPSELMAQAALLGYPALGIADVNTVAGVVRAHDAAADISRQHPPIRAVIGTRLRFADGTPDLLCYPTDRAAWGRLTRLLTLGRSQGEKLEKRPCILHAGDFTEWSEGQLLIAIPPARPDRVFADTLQTLAAPRRRSLWLAATRRYAADDASHLRALADLAAASRVPLVATNDVQYHNPSRRRLQDVITCVRLGCTMEKAGRRLAANAERHLKSPAEMVRLFRHHPGAIEQVASILDQARFSLADLRYQYPDEPVPPGSTPNAHLRLLAEQGAAHRYPSGVPEHVTAMLEKELALVALLDYARYFLTVHDIVRFACSKGILCQGRGSAANSALCFCLGVTAVDPMESNLLFERFLSAERSEPPDIDIDFEHERREEVIQYIYQRYGHARAGIAATVIHYRAKLAIRQAGKVMGLSEDTVAALSAQAWHRDGAEPWNGDRLAEIGLDAANPDLQQVVQLARELTGLPRHLSQHVGGFVLTNDRLDETVPVLPAAMKDRFFIEWDKDDIDSLRIMKVDVLALGMLTCLRKGLRMIRQEGVAIQVIADIPADDPAVFAMLSRGDSLGVFQVESRAQMNMLPRLKPKEFYDLVIEVAIVRPGPIQGDMVHPYLRRRQGKEDAVYAHPSDKHGKKDELEKILKRTLGVPLFQEQAMQIAIDAAKFTPGEANQLRRAMATFRNVGTIQNFERMMVERMVERGYDGTFAARCFNQIKGFGTYGFPESHAASFAKLVYASAWLKCYHPAAFACALLNSQPMGFYAPAQIVRDARDHEVPVRAIDVSHSSWDCTVEDGTLQLGLRLIAGFQQKWAATLADHRPYRSFEALAGAALPHAALHALAEADALRSMGLDRRQALWAARGLDDRGSLPLLAGQVKRPVQVDLPFMTEPEQVIADYQSAQLSIKAHPVSFLRLPLRANSVRSCADATALPDGTQTRVAGIVLVRQRPGSAKGVVFATIEDETGIANIVIWNDLQQRYRREMLAAAMLMIEGRVQRSEEGVVHIVAQSLHDYTAALRALADGKCTPPLARADEFGRPPCHPREERPVPRPRSGRRTMPPSRDFH